MKKMKTSPFYCPCCHGEAGHDDWCTPEVRAEVASIVIGDFAEGAQLSALEEFGLDPDPTTMFNK